MVVDDESVADSDDTIELSDDQVFNWSITAAEGHHEPEGSRRTGQGLTVAPLLSHVCSQGNPPHPDPNPSQDVRQLLRELIRKVYRAMEKEIHERRESANQWVRPLSQLLFVQSRLENPSLSPRPRRSPVEFENSVPRDMSRGLLAHINMASNEADCEFCRYDDCTPPMANSPGPIRFRTEVTSSDNDASQICRRCYSLRVAIITHTRHGNWYQWQQNPPANQQPRNGSSSERVISNDPTYPVSRKLKSPICDICTRTCSSRCQGCPLTVCGDCEGLLSHACNGNIDGVIRTIGKSRVRVDACLLSTAPASDWFSNWQRDPDMDPMESHFLDAIACVEGYDHIETLDIDLT